MKPRTRDHDPSDSPDSHDDAVERGRDVAIGAPQRRWDHGVVNVPERDLDGCADRVVWLDPERSASNRY